MTTLELIEKHGIGVNCLSDAYDLGVAQGRADAYTKIENEINYLLNCGMGKNKGLKLLLEICEAEQIKE